MIQLSFKQTQSEVMVRAAATVLFTALEREKVPLISIGEMCERPQYGFTASAALEPIGPKFVRITDLQDGKIDWVSVPFCKCEDPEKYTLGESDILFARTGATTGKTYLVRNPQLAVFASYLIRLRPKPNIEAGYLYSFFQSDNYWSQISEEKEGSAQPNVNGEKLTALVIPKADPALQQAIADFIHCVRRRQDGDSVELPELPPPLAERRRIVARIEELSQKIERARELRKQAAEEVESLAASWLNSIFSKFPPEYFHQLGDIAEIIGGGSLPDTTLMESGAAEVLFVKVSDMNRAGNEVFIQESAVGVPANSSILKGCRIVPPKAIVFPKRGGAIATNKKRLLQRSAVLDPNMMGVFAKNEQDLTPEFLFRWFGDLDLASMQEGTSVPQINKSDLAPLAIPVPPLPEQQQIVAYLDDLQQKTDSLKTLQAETSAELDALMPSILDKAFRGEL